MDGSPFEVAGRPRPWTPDEQQFAASMADLVAQAVIARRSELALRASEARTGAVVEASRGATGG